MKPIVEALVPPLLVCAGALVLIAVRGRRGERRGRSRAIATDATIIMTIVAWAALVELGMGRTPTYVHGPVRPWSGDIRSDQNSQQVADPYTFTHFVHGAILYGLTGAALGGDSIGLRAIVAATTESAWEVFENTDLVINRYREETISLDYYGDSIINSVFDIVATLLGFGLAWRFPARITVAWVIALELVLALWVRDNLTLNVLMLVYPIPAVRNWQLWR